MRKSEPIEQLSLSRVSENGTSIAVISSQAGAISQLLLNGVSVIPEFLLPNPEDFIFGSLLAPWPNRLEDGQYRHSGTNYEFDELDLQNNKNHGLLLDRNLEVRRHEQSELVLGYRFGEDDQYPFLVDLEVSYLLQPKSLQVMATARNLGQAAPFAIGFHPYFLTCEPFSLTAAFTHVGLNDSRMLPYAVETISGLNLNENSSELRTMDSFFSGSDLVKVSGASGEFEIRTLENLPYFMLYRPAARFFPTGGAIAIEPMSAPTNAFRNDPDSVLLAAGEQKRYRFEIRTP